jgi:membrane protein DedA with SNARE-associated domain
VSFLEFVKDWGYIAVFLGSLIEGESILLVASALSACGHLSIVNVFITACVSTILADQVLFFVGYKWGASWLTDRFPSLKKAEEKIFSLLRRVDALFIFSFRFIYGIRTISPVIIGSAKIKPKRFVVFNIFAGICWAFVSCFVGYAMADVFVEGSFSLWPAILIISSVVILALGVFILRVKLRKKAGK